MNSYNKDYADQIWKKQKIPTVPCIRGAYPCGGGGKRERERKLRGRKGRETKVEGEEEREREKLEREEPLTRPTAYEIPLASGSK